VVSKRFYRDLLGFVIAEEDPEHGSVFMTLGNNFHTVDIGQHPAPETARRPERGQIGRGHISFQVGSYAALRPTLTLSAAASRSCAPQCSFYFADPDGNTLEIYYELPHALELFPDGRADLDQALQVSRPVAQLAARRLAAAGDAGEDREPAARLGLSI
jgi:catechol 2,3-dioxygenase